MKINWNKKITLTLEELYQLILTSTKVKPSKRIKSRSSFNTGVMSGFSEANKNFVKLVENLDKKENSNH